MQTINRVVYLEVWKNCRISAHYLASKRNRVLSIGNFYPEVTPLLAHHAGQCAKGLISSIKRQVFLQVNFLALGYRSQYHDKEIDCQIFFLPRWKNESSLTFGRSLWLKKFESQITKVSTT